ncbi:MAG TPA: ATP-dependent zinc metalloprotease FtsH [Myxococcota bacterium]|nr:ATP-dependent zinc metalloprotease FtsH [Myxococcales bacterium]HPG25393.1 ATP-dependent zinc metalloprotease FtsH [Myxococcota bacterium]
MRERPRFHMAFLMLAILGVILLRDLWTEMQSVEQIPFSEFEKLLDEGQISEVVVQDDLIRGVVKKPLDGGKKEFVTRRVEADLADRLAEKGVDFSSRPESTFLPTLLSWLVPIALFAGVWMWMTQRMAKQMGTGGGLLSIGRSKAKVYVETDTQVTFADVAGVDEAKAELEEVVDFLKDPESHGRLGARMPKGILLVGPPGTGKTLLARAVAGEAGVAFFSISGSEFVEMFVGVGAARVRDLFEQARQHAPCIIFVDELDALGRARGAQGGFGGHDEKEQTLNQLLVELDGFDPRAGIVLLAATNRPEILDPALLRAGRFDRHVLVDRPDRGGRTAILRVHMKKVKIGQGVDPDAIAALTPGFTGADLANLVNEAALGATRRGAAAVESGDFTSAIERIVAGLEKRSRLLSPREREIVAHHEMGHALVASALPGTDPVHKVSIIPRGIGALGYTLQRPTEDRYLVTRQEMESKLAVLQGGRAAELLIFGQASTGAADDLARATQLARDMATRYAMVPALGNATYEETRESFLGGPSPLPDRRHSEETAREIDLAVRRIVDDAFERAHSILTRHRDVLEASAAELQEREHLEEGELARFFEKIDRHAAPSDEAGAAPR